MSFEQSPRQENPNSSLSDRDLPDPSKELRKAQILRGIAMGSAMGLALGLLIGIIVIQIVQYRRIEASLFEIKNRDQASGRSSSEANSSRDSRPPLNDAGAESVPLTDQEGRVLGEVVMLPDGRAYFVNSALPALSEVQTYQLWAIIEGDQKISAGLLGPNPSVEQLRINGPVKGFSVTAEGAGGVVQSQNQAVVRGFRKPRATPDTK
jgi:hypothetical protein